MRVLFFIGHDGFIRNFERVIRDLAGAGHSVHLAVAARRTALMSEARTLEELCRTTANTSFDRAPRARGEAMSPLLALLGASRSFLRFQGPEYEGAPKLRARAAEYIPPSMHRFLTLPLVRSRPCRRALDAILLGVIDGLPTSSAMDEYIRAHSPDLVVVSPLILMREVTQVSAVRSARRAGIPSALLVHSWDNLTNKGLIHAAPDRVVVWNNAQKEEAVRLHGVPGERVAVTGAHSYDHWFDWSPASTREQFCATVGLDATAPFILYVCSSAFIAPKESRFVRRWVAALRASPHEALRTLGVLVRPHPQNAEQWLKLRRADLDGAVVYPLDSRESAGTEARSAYFDSIHHAEAVVGINTTALIESAIQGKQVLTLLAPEFKDTQEGTLHFQHLAAEDGLLLVAETLAEHHEQLLAALDAPDIATRSRRFVETFVRPHGYDVAGTPRVVDELLALATGGAEPSSRPGLRRRLAAVALWPLGRLLLVLVSLVPQAKQAQSADEKELRRA